MSGRSDSNGRGKALNADFKADTNNELHFPLIVDYTSTIDPNGVILAILLRSVVVIESVDP